MNTNTKFNILSGAIFIFILLSVLTSYELSKGAHLLQLNFNHVKYNNTLLENVMQYEEGALNNLETLRKDMLDVREQPVLCLKAVNTIERLFMRAIKTESALDLCDHRGGLINHRPQSGAHLGGKLGDVFAITSL